MSVRYEKREIKQPVVTEIKLVEAVCDRCGANAKFVGFITEEPPIWGITQHYRQGVVTGQPEQHELCRNCSEELLLWIRNGKR